MFRTLKSATVLLALCAALSSATKEEAEVSDDKLSQYIRQFEKRLRQMEGQDGLQQASQCHYQRSLHSIIRANTSLINGAKFVAVKNVTSEDECNSQCCNSADCDLAVYKLEEAGKSRGKHACYLFLCGSPSVCLFSQSDGFVSTVVANNARVAKQHEDDLEELVKVKPTTTTTTTTTTSPPTTTTTTTTTSPHRQPVALFGRCQHDKDCAGTFTECYQDHCLCVRGYHPQEGACRKDCSHFEFECLNEGAPLLQPQCIAIYDKCDGVPHCKDASDERHCEPSPEDKSESDGDEAETEAAPTKPPHKKEPSRPHAHRPVKTPAPATPKPPAIKETPAPPPAATPTPAEKTTRPPATSTPVTRPAAPTKKPTKEEPHAQQPGDDEEEVEVKAERLLLPSNRVAVIVLGLGLAITALLLMFVGCRLRNVKHRLRKGRPMNTNEADYLINGMYL